MKYFFTFFLLMSCWGWAEEPEQNQAYVDEPGACFHEQKMPCAVRITQSSYKFETVQAKIYGRSGSSFVFLKDGGIRLLEGIFFVEADQNIKVEAGTIEALVQGESLFQKPEKAGATVTNFSGNNLITGVFQKFSEPIPAGLSKWYAGANQKGELEQGVLTPINPRLVLPEWRNLTVYPKTFAKEKLSHYKATWKNGAEYSAEFYKEIVERRLAVEDEKRIKREKHLQFEKEERLKLRQLFRERNNLN